MKKKRAAGKRATAKRSTKSKGKPSRKTRSAPAAHAAADVQGFALATPLAIGVYPNPTLTLA